MTGAKSAPFSVLMVCTANLCRSPLGEHLMRAELAARGVDWTVSSAGTHAREGQPMHSSAARLLAQRGIDASTFTTRRLNQQMIADADLILTASGEHRAAVTRLQPGALARTHTLLQFAYLAQAVSLPTPLPSTETGPLLREHVSEARGSVQPLPTNQRDLPDPIRQSFFRFRKCAAMIEEAIDQILSEVAPRSWSWTTSAGG